jgi:outer membrane immunogenic protein
MGFSSSGGTVVKYNIIRGISISTLLLVAPISVASAADMALKAPPAPAPVYSWTGWYAGVNLGGSFGKAADTSTFGAGPTLLSSTSSRLDGVIGGGQIGYNWQLAARARG